MKFKRPKRSRTIAAERRTWESRCKGYRVIESHIPYAFGLYRGAQHLGYSDLYYAMLSTIDGWSIISRHRRRNAAERACERHEQKHR